LIQSLLAGLGISKYSIMGASSGGMIALYVASGHPERVDKLVVIGGQVRYSNKTREVIIQGGPDYLDPEYMRRATEKHGAKKAYQLGRQFWRFRLLEGDPDITPVMLAGIQARTLIVHGDNDPIAPVSNAVDMFNGIPGASLWVVPDGKHLPHLNKRFQPEFFRTMGEFLYSK
jgi:pimeloyl-ACP methyl ester carboxylesterase